MDMAGLLSTNNLIIPFITQASQAKTWYLCSRTYDNGINDRMIKYFEDAVNGINSEVPLMTSYRPLLREFLNFFLNMGLVVIRPGNLKHGQFSKKYFSNPSLR